MFSTTEWMRGYKWWTKTMDTHMDGSGYECKRWLEKEILYLRNLLKENSENFYNDIYTCRVTNLENALHSVGLNK